MATHLIHEPTIRRGWRGPSAVAIAAMVAMAGCSSSTKTASTAATTAGTGSATTAASAASSCVADANTFLKDYQQLPTALPASFTALSKAPKPGGTVIKIVNGGIPSDGHSADEQAVAAQAIGWTAKKIVFHSNGE